MVEVFGPASKKTPRAHTDLHDVRQPIFANFIEQRAVTDLE